MSQQPQQSDDVREEVCRLLRKQRAEITAKLREIDPPKPRAPKNRCKATVDWVDQQHEQEGEAKNDH